MISPVDVLVVPHSKTIEGLYHEHVTCDVEACIDDVEMRAVYVFPLDGTLRDWNIRLSAKEQDFDVECPSLEVLSWEYPLCRVAGEYFESTLGVLVREPKNKLDDY